MDLRQFKQMERPAILSERETSLHDMEMSVHSFSSESTRKTNNCTVIKRHQQQLPKRRSSLDSSEVARIAREVAANIRGGRSSLLNDPKIALIKPNRSISPPKHRALAVAAEEEEETEDDKQQIQSNHDLSAAAAASKKIRKRIKQEQMNLGHLAVEKHIFKALEARNLNTNKKQQQSDSGHVGERKTVSETNKASKRHTKLALGNKQLSLGNIYRNSDLGPSTSGKAARKQQDQRELGGKQLSLGNIGESRSGRSWDDGKVVSATSNTSKRQRPLGKKQTSLSHLVDGKNNKGGLGKNYNSIAKQRSLGHLGSGEGNPSSRERSKTQKGNLSNSIHSSDSLDELMKLQEKYGSKGEMLSGKVQRRSLTSISTSTPSLQARNLARKLTENTEQRSPSPKTSRSQERKEARSKSADKGRPQSGSTGKESRINRRSFNRGQAYASANALESFSENGNLHLSEDLDHEKAAGKCIFPLQKATGESPASVPTKAPSAKKSPGRYSSRKQLMREQQQEHQTLSYIASTSPVELSDGDDPAKAYHQRKGQLVVGKDGKTRLVIELDDEMDDEAEETDEYDATADATITTKPRKRASVPNVGSPRKPIRRESIHQG